MTAVALQDHMARCLSLKSTVKFGNSKRKGVHVRTVEIKPDVEKLSARENSTERILDPLPIPLTLGKCFNEEAVLFILLLIK